MIMIFSAKDKTRKKKDIVQLLLSDKCERIPNFLILHIETIK